MTKTIFAIVLLSLALTACESTSPDNSNANAAKPNTNSQVSPTPLPSPTLAASPSASPQIKAGDKVKVTINGSLTDATVISVDENVGKLKVKILGQKEEKTVAIGDIKQ